MLTSLLLFLVDCLASTKFHISLICIMYHIFSHHLCAVYLFIGMYLVGGSTSITCSFVGASAYTWFDQEANALVTNSVLSVSYNDSIHHKLFTCIGANSTAVVGFESIKYIISGKLIILV